MIARSRLVLASVLSIFALSLPTLAHADESGGMESPGLFGAGVFFTSAGIAGLATGGYFFSKGSGACDDISRSSIPSEDQVLGCRDGVIQQVGGVVGMVTGGAFVLAGLPMMIVGGTSADDEPAPRRVTVSVGPTSGQLSISF